MLSQDSSIPLVSVCPKPKVLNRAVRSVWLSAMPSVVWRSGRLLVTPVMLHPAPQVVGATQMGRVYSVRRRDGRCYSGMRCVNSERR